MDTITDARRQAGMELQALAEEFEGSDESAFRRSRIACWVVTAAAGLIALVFLLAAADWRYVLLLWFTVSALSWLTYFLSVRRQRAQTARLRDMANRWLGVKPVV
ncbi:hypothetical protein HHL28_00165 [Aerophototrophica crusticola]|uniref:Uncharacterized protein n=1 Tax=Aerophototrophica crusticola TaxID=1709002 RepID=A0A858R3Q9_9PROT|nr:hypothetical protein HHL28_00165 [Rhodospirillaceae bacterium B3]